MQADRDPLGLALIDAYIGVFEVWRCRLDEEDGSTAPFSSMALAEALGVANEMAICLAVEME